MKLEEIKYSEGSALGVICLAIAEKGQKATRVASQHKIIECRLVGRKWHYFVAGEFVDETFTLPDGTMGKRSVERVYAEPGTVNSEGESL